jgi:hypothetical protein
MRKMLLAVFAAVVLCISPALAAAQDFWATSRTYLQLRESVNDKDLAPAFEYLDLNATDLWGGRDISFHAGGWVRLDLADRSGEDDLNQDLSYAYLSYRITPALLVRGGRVLVFEGVASEIVDGAYAALALPVGFRLAVYSGVPVETDNDGREGDVIYGVRASHQRNGLYTIGLSYLKEDNDSGNFREEEGIDLLVTPADWLQVTGLSTYNSESDGGWMEHTYRVDAGPFSKVSFGGTFSHIDYEHYFFNPTVSAFAFPQINPEETLDMYGVHAAYKYSYSLTASAEYKRYEYDIMGGANNFGGAVDYYASPYRAGASIHRMDGDTDELRYNQYRVYAQRTLGAADVTVDFFDVQYDEKRNDIEHALALVGALGYNFTKRARGGVDLEYAQNPFFDDELKVFLKFIYRWGKQV